jgi:hypothetical protein
MESVHNMKHKFAISLLVLFLAGTATAAPIITSFNPTFGATNDTGFITITGSGFYPGTLQVYFGNTLATNYAATLADGTEIQTRIRIGTPSGPCRIRVFVKSKASV